MEKLKLSEEEKNIILEQNSIIKNVVKNKFKIENFDIARTRNNNVVIIKHLDHYNSIGTRDVFMYMLGINNKTKNILLYKVGECSVLFFTNEPNLIYPNQKTNDPYIGNLGIHPAFQNLGLSRILLQCIENAAVKMNKKHLRLDSLKSFVVKKDYTQIKRFSKPKENLNAFFDKNFYLYSTQGYQLSKENNADPNSKVRFLVKENIENKDLNFPLEPIVFIDKNDEKFSLASQPDFVIDHLNKYSYENYFIITKEDFPSKDFSPISLNPTNNDSLLLSETLQKNYNPIELFSTYPQYKTTASNKHIAINHLIYSKEFSHLNKINPFILENEESKI